MDFALYQQPLLMTFRQQELLVLRAGLEWRLRAEKESNSRRR
jgi:hypothetical protein